MRKTNMLRRAAAALALAVGVLAVTGTGAGAAVVTPAILDGFSNTTAAKLKITIPSLDELINALEAAGLPTSGIPNIHAARTTLEQAISVNSGNARRQGSTSSASGFAAPAIGSLLNRSDKSSCSSASCDSGEPIGALRVSVLDAVTPGGIGRINLLPADSATSSYLDTKNTTGLVEVDLDASKLLGANGTLAPVGGALTLLANTINTSVLPVVNPAIQTLVDTVDGADALKPVRDELYRYITLGQIKAIPDPAATKLLTFDVLTGSANVVREVRDNTTGLHSTATSTVKDLKVLGGWVSIESLKVTASAYANGVKAGAEATNNATVVGGTLGGLINADISEGDLARLADPETIKNLIRDTVPGLESQVEDVAAAIDILYNTAGITIEQLPDSTTALPNGRFARASAGTLRITVEPKIPILANGVVPAGSVVPRLAADDYVSTGLSLVLDLPTAEVQASAGEVQCLGRCINRTGVGTPWIAVLLMFAAAFAVKRYGFAK